MTQTKIQDLLKPINTLYKLPEKTIKNLASININRIIDALLYFPKSTKNRKLCKTSLDLESNRLCIINLKVLSHSKVGRNRLNIYCEDTLGNTVIINYFRYFSFTVKYYPVGDCVMVSGLCNRFNNVWYIIHPEKVSSVNNIKQILQNESVYKSKQGLQSSTINNVILKCIDVLKEIDIPEWYDNAFLEEYKLPSFKEALLQLHNPQIEDKSSYLLRIALDELLAYHINLQKIKLLSQEINGISLKGNESLCLSILKSLPFELTKDQKLAFKSIRRYLYSNSKSIILLQGDVGSGKSIVLFLSALLAVESGYQVALLAPTSVLAKQHYDSLLQYCKGLVVSIGLLLGGTKKKEKEILISSLSNKEIDILISTHAILNDDITFNSLGLVIIDEQHKFGVAQRLKLTKKGNNPNLILATATPIPRTLILANYGDIDVVSIREKPKSRKEIITTSLSIQQIESLMDKIIHLINKKEKVFWVCSLVETSEGLTLTSIKEREIWFSKNYPNLKLFILHGKLSNKKKEEIIEEFKQYPKGAILLSTTVIEVGIDIPECNILIIEDSQNLGLAQLHQLRGRVGRGEKQAYCILLYSSSLGKTAKKRINVIKETNDGFYLAEADLKIRGYGDVLGTYQSGHEYFIAYDIKEHYKYLSPIIDLAKLFVKQDNIHNQILESIFYKNNVKDYFYNG